MKTHDRFPFRGYHFAVLLTLLFFTNCDYINPFQGPFLSEHKIELSNDTPVDLHVEYRVTERYLDVNRKINERVLDTAFTVPASTRIPMVTLQYDRFHRFPLDYELIEDTFLSLKVYQLRNGEADFAEIDMLDEDRWIYFNNDPLSFSKEIYHSYFLKVAEEDFD